MQIYNALQLKNGAKAEYNRMGTLNQPIQFIPKKKKDQEWAAWNMDWLEFEGTRQVRRNARRLLKNYKLAKGIIDKTDYIVEEDNEYADLIEVLTKEDQSALELKFYPIIPNVINVLANEFAKRSTRVTYRAVDENSYNDMIEIKRQQIEDYLIYNATQELMLKLSDAGMDLATEQAQQQLAPDNIKSLPEIQSYFDKTYRSNVEQWAEHQHKEDSERYGLDELEERGFRDMLITDREFWHFRMMDDDYSIELWNPVLTFYNKSPEARYISEGNWVGKFDMFTVADVIDRYGWMMTEEQLESLEAIYPVRSAGYPIQGYQNDGSYYDATKSHAWNTNRPSLGYRQFTSYFDNRFPGGDVIDHIMSESEDYFDLGNSNLLRVTTAYWKSQVKVGHLTKIDESGEVTTEIVSEDYKIVDKPLYNTNLKLNKTKDNLIFGEHIDWIWINEVWGGIKIGPHRPSYWGTGDPGGITPIYLGISQNLIKPLKFQFKGENNLYGCKLPVEGSIFSDRNTNSVSLVDLMKPFQIAYNIVNNQIADILVDELGTVILLDQNALPRHSLGEDWGKNNLAKAYVAMKNFQMLPLDTTITNTENALAFQHYQPLDLSQTNRLLGRIQLANYFKMQAFETIGITPQRLGQQIGAETATGIQQSINASYAQTESYFIQHADYLMPRVHRMRTDLAQYYQSENPSVRLQYITSTEERAFFEIEGTDLLMRDLNIHCTTKSNHRAILEQLKQLALSNNTTGASIFDLGNIVKAESISEINEILKDTEQKSEMRRQQEMQQQQQMQEQMIQAKQEEERLKREYEAMESDKNRQKDLLIAQIRAAGYGAMQDINQNLQSDYMDAIESIQKSEQYQEQMNLQSNAQSLSSQQHRDKMNIEQQKLAIAQQKLMTELEIAKTNKNQYDLMTKSKQEKTNKKKK
jgi:hypothetical protein